MNVWVVAISEPVGMPVSPGRLLRAGTLTRYLLAAGHHVCWWNSTFDHASKRHIRNADNILHFDDGHEIRLMHSPGYSTNVSLRRVLDHFVIARKFSRMIARESPPDVIVCSFPTIELSLECVRYGAARGVPVLIDVRDPWPDVFVSAVPSALRPAGRMFLRPYFSWTREAMKGAAAIAAVSRGYLDWALEMAGREQRSGDAVFVHGYDQETAAFTPAERAATLRSLNINPSRIIVWFVGTMGNSYDLVPVIGTARRLQRDGDSRVHFVFSGNGPKMAAWQRLAADLRNVTFTGWVERPELQKLMGVADIGLAAYRPAACQSLPFKIFEYMAAGVPILSSLAGEGADMLRTHRCGLSYEAGSLESFSSMLALLVLNARLRAELGRNGLSAFQNSYSGTRIYPAMVAWVEHAAASREKHSERCG